MKRDMDLVRKILQKLESKGDPLFSGMSIEPNLFSVEGYSENQVNYHLTIMGEAGLISIIDSSSKSDPFGAIPLRLTWAGHEFLETSRNEKLWSKAKKMLTEKIGGLSFEILKETLIQLIKENLSLP